MSIVIKENFVPQDFFTKMQSLMLGEEFPWYFSEPIDMDQLNPDLLCDPLDNFQLCHTFYANDEPVSPFYPVCIEPFVKALGMRHLIRIKVNLNLRAKNIINRDSMLIIIIMILLLLYYMSILMMVTRSLKMEKKLKVSKIV